jgi:hypothetical protein
MLSNRLAERAGIGKNAGYDRWPIKSHGSQWDRSADNYQLVQ